MNELAAILECLTDAAAHGQTAVLATVVGVQGSAYRRPGARLALLPDGHRIGLISGGCLEGDVAKKAWWRTERGPIVVRYDTNGDEDGWAFGLGCNGVVDVLLERIDPATPPAFLAVLSDWSKNRQAGVLVRTLSPKPGAWLVCDGAGETRGDLAAGDSGSAFADAAWHALAERRSTQVTIGGATAFIEYVPPPPALVICGAGPDAVPVVRLAKELGWNTTVCARPRPLAKLTGTVELDAHCAGAPDEALRRAYLSDEVAAVAMSHNYDDDREYLRTLLSSPVGFIGMLGPRRRTDAMLGELRSDGVDVDGLAAGRLYAPVGLDIGGDAPAEIALAIVAEIRAVRSGRSGNHLRGRVGPMHDAFSAERSRVAVGHVNAIGRL